jgi:5'-methylthioadenosine phosphorylase
MGRLGIIGGHGLLGSAFACDAATIAIEAPDRSPVCVFDTRDYAFVQRHGHHEYRPPHRVDHLANLGGLASIGCDRILAVGSVGGLRTDQRVSDVVVPDDFIALGQAVSTFEDAQGHGVRGFDARWRRAMTDTWQEVSGTEVTDGGVYWQTMGPRFETPAEIRLLSQFADIVGMTVASECIIAGELGLSYAAVCVIDNLANGLSDDTLSMDSFEAGKAANQPSTVATLEQVARALA